MSISSQFFSELTIYIYIAPLFIFSCNVHLCLTYYFLFLQVTMYICKTLSRILLSHFTNKQPRGKGEISYLIFLIKF
jgi:hypothetical protein